MSDSNLPKDVDFANRVEGTVRKFFERLGGALDFVLRRPLNPQVRTDITALIPQLERAIEDQIRHEGSKIIAPNLIELRYDYETYSKLTSKRVEFLQRELRLSAYEFIHNRRYTTVGDVNVKLGYDMFTRKLTFLTSFSDEDSRKLEKNSTSDEVEKSVKSPNIPTFEIGLKSSRFEINARGNARITVGRSHDNALIIEDRSVSSVHAAFINSPKGAIFMSDLGSSNGTFVNGIQIPMGDKAIVKSGDQLRLGNVEATLSCKII